LELKLVNRRLSRRRRNHLNLVHFISGGAPIINQVSYGEDDLPYPVEAAEYSIDKELPIMLMEIPADFVTLKAQNLSLALKWRLHARA
jgi:hypothetical protein